RHATIGGTRMPTASVHREQDDADEQAGQMGQAESAVSVPSSSELPCRADPDLWFAEEPRDLERAKVLCTGCPIKAECLAGALARAEPWGVWGGEILNDGVVVNRKRRRGRPRKHPRPEEYEQQPAS